MRGFTVGTAALLATAAWTGPAVADGVEVRHAWARATVEGMYATGVFLVIDNESGRDVRLVGGTSAAAEAVEVHTMVSTVEGQMMMRRLKDGLPVPAGATVELRPGAEHVMLIGLRRPLAPGDTVPLALEFSDGGTVRVAAAVRGRARDGRHDDHHGDHHDDRHDDDHHHDDHHGGRGDGHHDH